MAALSAMVARAEHRSSRKRPRGRDLPKRRDKSARRYLAEVIRSHRLAPGLRVDRNMIAALFTGHRELVGNPVLVVAVAQACGIISGRKLTSKEAARLRAASERVARLIRRAQEAGPVPAQAPIPVPAPAAPPPAETRPVPTQPAAETLPAAETQSAAETPPAGQTQPAVQARPVQTRPPVEASAVPVRAPEPEPAPAAGGSRTYWPIVAVALLLALVVLGALLAR
ncbi:hypothetical protein ACQP1P_22655 [Dactylosporangium sp. CA-052675]|uniref:hypothetical protein n=1 Tax=Dactylosporangium sp. CA-052675 TaxID=3239927 RepID=UPI003D91E8A8